MAETVVDALAVQTTGDCKDCPPVEFEPLDDYEVLARLETHSGMQSWAIRYDILAEHFLEAVPAVMKELPDFIKMPLDAFLFALRHTALPKAAKKLGVNTDLFLKREGVDKNAATAALAMYLANSFIRKEQRTGGKDGGMLPVDFMQKDITDAYQGVFRRVPSYDALPIYQPDDEPEALAEPTGA